VGQPRRTAPHSYPVGGYLRRGLTGRWGASRGAGLFGGWGLLGDADDAVAGAQRVERGIVEAEDFIASGDGYRCLVLTLGLADLAGTDLALLDVEALTGGQKVVDNTGGGRRLGRHSEDAPGRCGGNDHLVCAGG